MSSHWVATGKEHNIFHLADQGSNHHLAVIYLLDNVYKINDIKQHQEVKAVIICCCKIEN